MTEIGNPEARLQVRVHGLHELVSSPDKGSAPDLVPTNDFPEARDKRVRVERTRAANRERFRIQGHERCKLTVEPNLFLAERDRSELIRRAARYYGSSVPPLWPTRHAL